MLALTGLERMFYWAAAQALEKYFKALLLQQGISVKKYSHRLVEMAKENAPVFEFLNEVELTPSEKLKSKMGVATDAFWSMTSIDKFLNHIEEYGSTDNRYNQVGNEYDVSVLVILDRVVHCLQSQLVRNSQLTEKTPRMDSSISHFFLKNNETFMSCEPPTPNLSMSVTTLERALKDCYGHRLLYEKWLKQNIKISDKNIENLKSK
jgi:hypothetical protein